MKIRFNRRKLTTQLIIGIVWILLGVSHFLFGDSIAWLGLGYLIIGSFDLANFVYNRKNQYLIIENDTLQKNKLFGSVDKIDLDKIQKIKKVGGDYILKSETKHLKINIDLIDNESLIELIEVLKNLNLPSEKTCLAN